MGLVFRLLEMLIVIVPVAAALIAALRAFSAAQRKREDASSDPRHHDAITSTEAPSAVNSAALWRMVTRGIDEHTRTDARWLEYELDAAKLLDFPLMTDMREPLTERFHRAKIGADLFRPARAEDLLDDRESAAKYLAAVEDYVAAFDAAEAEAIRKRRKAFTDTDQQRLARAQRLLRMAADEAASRHEREQAYEFARDELDGLIVLPPATVAAIERGIAGEIDQ